MHLASSTLRWSEMAVTVFPHTIIIGSSALYHLLLLLLFIQIVLRNFEILTYSWTSFQHVNIPIPYEETTNPCLLSKSGYFFKHFSNIHQILWDLSASSAMKTHSILSTHSSLYLNCWKKYPNRQTHTLSST